MMCSSGLYLFLIIFRASWVGIPPHLNFAMKIEKKYKLAFLDVLIVENPSYPRSYSVSQEKPNKSKLESVPQCKLTSPLAATSLVAKNNTI